MALPQLLVFVKMFGQSGKASAAADRFGINAEAAVFMLRPDIVEDERKLLNSGDDELLAVDN